MSRTMKTAAIVVLVLILAVGALIVWRLVHRSLRTTQEGFVILTTMPGSVGFEPKTLPDGPVLENRTPGSLTVDFGYELGGKAYAYTLALTFAAGATDGRAIVTAQRDGHSASTETDAMRRFDEPRKAYSVALSDKFMLSPPVPGLCIKAVIGPDLDRVNPKNGSICVAQRDKDGNCHPETLACGLLR